MDTEMNVASENVVEETQQSPTKEEPEASSSNAMEAGTSELEVVEQNAINSNAAKNANNAIATEETPAAESRQIASPAVAAGGTEENVTMQELNLETVVQDTDIEQDSVNTLHGVNENTEAHSATATEGATSQVPVAVEEPVNPLANDKVEIISDIILPNIAQQTVEGNVEVSAGVFMAQNTRDEIESGQQQAGSTQEESDDEEMPEVEAEATTDNVTAVESTKATSDDVETNVDDSNPVAPQVTPSANASGLSLLAQYDSESDKEDDNESVVEVPTQSNYRNQVVHIDSDTESSSSSDSDVQYLNEIRKKIDKRIQCDDESDADDDDDGTGAKNRKRQPPKVKGELLLEDLPPIQDLYITVPEEECTEFGKVHSIVDQLVLVSAKPNSILCDLDTVLFLEKGKKVLGMVFDVLGQVADPLYCVRFNSNKQIQERNIQIGDTVYVAPKTEHTQYVILSSLMSMRGSDASWEHDVEPPPKCLDYSDDEEERAARQRARNKKRTADGASVVELNSDDEDSTSVYSTAESTCSTQISPRGRQQNYRNERRNNRGGGGGGGGDAMAGSSNYGRNNQYQSRYNRNRNNYNNYQNDDQRSYNQRSNDGWHSNFHPHSGQMRHRAPFYPSRPMPPPHAAAGLPPPYAGGPPRPQHSYGMQPPTTAYPPPDYLQPYGRVPMPYQQPQPTPQAYNQFPDPPPPGMG